MRVARCGICGTDVHIYRNEYMSDFPLIPGHEFGGVVVEVGKEVKDVRVGERVAVDPNLYCGHCDFCRDEQANHCANWQGVGITRAGGFAEYAAVPARACYHLPDSLSDAQAAFVEPLACVVHALKRFHVAPGSQTLLFGAGPMGLLLVQALRHYGASGVVVVEKQPERLALAQQMGATAVVTAGPDQDEHLRGAGAAWLRRRRRCHGCARGYRAGVSLPAAAGQYLQFGVTPKNAQVTLSPYDIFKNDWTIVGSFALCYTFLPAIAWLAGGIIDVGPLVSHTLPMSQFRTGFDQFAAGQTLKVHIVPGG